MKSGLDKEDWIAQTLKASRFEDNDEIMRVKHKDGAYTKVYKKEFVRKVLWPLNNELRKEFIFQILEVNKFIGTSVSDCPDQTFTDVLRALSRVTCSVGFTEHT